MHMTEGQRQSVEAARVVVKVARGLIADGLRAISKPEPSYCEAMAAFAQAEDAVSEAKRLVKRAWLHGDE